ELPPPPPPASDVVTSGAQSGDEAGQAKSSATTWGLVRNNLGLLASLGVGVLLVGAIRAIRFAAVPLWSEHIGLSASMTSAVVGLSGLFDIALFYPAGKVMDVKGRMWVAVPSMALLGAGIMLLPVAHTLGALIAIAALIGIGNGIGAGIIMTTGADAAPVDGRAKFLSVWRFMSDFGGAAGPLIISLGTALGSLVGGIVGAGVTGLLASAVLAAALPRWSVHATNRTRRAHGVPVPQWRRKRG
ncbi:MAG: MFS transporter, partial [Bifidobacteriaceae bacterium]|nr:MFS transporter [Bifidobacteriaceae bacterium]